MSEEVAAGREGKAQKQLPLAFLGECPSIPVSTERGDLGQWVGRGVQMGVGTQGQAHSQGTGNSGQETRSGWEQRVGKKGQHARDEGGTKLRTYQTRWPIGPGTSPRHFPFTLSKPDLGFFLLGPSCHQARDLGIRCSPPPQPVTHEPSPSCLSNVSPLLGRGPPQL